MNREEHIEFLQGLNDDYLMKHIRAYVRNGMDEQAARAMQERDRRKEGDDPPEQSDLDADDVIAVNEMLNKRDRRRKERVN